MNDDSASFAVREIILFFTGPKGIISAPWTSAMANPHTFSSRSKCLQSGKPLLQCFLT
jgi:hypothetical protein